MFTTPDKLGASQLLELRFAREERAVDTVKAIGNRTLNLRAEILTSRSEGEVSATQAEGWLNELQALSETCLNKIFDVLTSEKDETKLTAKYDDLRPTYDRELDSLTEKVHQTSYGPNSSRKLSIAGTENIPSWAMWDHNDYSKALSKDPDLSEIAQQHRSKQPGIVKLRDKWWLASGELREAGGVWNVSVPESTQKYAMCFKEYRTAATALARSKFAGSP